LGGRSCSPCPATRGQSRHSQHGSPRFIESYSDLQVASLVRVSFYRLRENRSNIAGHEAFSREEAVFDALQPLPRTLA